MADNNNFKDLLETNIENTTEVTGEGANVTPEYFAAMGIAIRATLFRTRTGLRGHESRHNRFRNGAPGFWS